MFPDRRVLVLHHAPSPACVIRSRDQVQNPASRLNMPTLAAEQLQSTSNARQTMDETDVDGIEPLNGPDLEPPKWMTTVPQDDVRAYLQGLPLTTRVSKRLVDIVVASGLLVVAAPIMLVAAIAIKATSPGPVIFTQIRAGLNNRRRNKVTGNPFPICRRRKPNFGRPFVIYKLRTMHVDSDANGPTQAQQDDDRVFKAGKLFRRLRIDELPQLVNVLRGEMSMVGPRPECIDYMDELSKQIPNYLDRLGLKPGLTGIAQIEAGYANDLESYQRKIAFDLMYLKNCCVWNDVKIMVRTARVVLSGFGAL